MKAAKRWRNPGEMQSWQSEEESCESCEETDEEKEEAKISLAINQWKPAGSLAAKITENEENQAKMTAKYCVCVKLKISQLKKKTNVMKSEMKMTWLQ